MDLIIDGIRWVLWLLCKGCFFLIDSIYNIIEPIICFDIASNSTLWVWWWMLCSFLFFFTVIRVVSMFLKSSVDDDVELKFNPVQIIIRIIVIAIVIAFMPMTVKFFSSLSSSMVSIASTYFKVENNFAENKPVTGDPEKDKQINQIYKEYEGMPSQIFISSASNGTYPPYQLIDINKTEGGLDNVLNGIPIISNGLDLLSGLIGADGSYVYFKDTTMLIFLIVEAICGAYLFILMAIQISQRIVSIGIKILISPIPISGIVNPNDNSFGLWIKLLIADLLSNFIQYLILLFVFMISSSKGIQQFGIVGQGIFFLGGMLAVLIGPGQIAQIIGGDGMGLFQTMQGFQTISALKGMTQATSHAVTGAIGGASALGVYGAGRFMGLQSLGNFPGANDDNGGSGSFGQSGGRNSWGGKQASSKIPSKAFQEPVTEKQIIAAKKLGFDASHMSKGQASLELERRGADRSFFHGQDKGFEGFKDGSATGTINKGNQTYGYDNIGSSYTSETPSHESNNEGHTYDSSRYSGQGVDASENVSGYDSSASSTSNSEGSSENRNASSSIQTDGRNIADSQQTDIKRMSREGSIARKIGDSSSLPARTAYMLGRTAYSSAANRLMGQKSVYRGGKYINRNTKAQVLSNMHHGINSLRQNPNTINDNLSKRDQEDLQDLENNEKNLDKE